MLGLVERNHSFVENVVAQDEPGDATCLARVDYERVDNEVRISNSD